MSTIFWDFDGTLVYSFHLWSSCLYKALTAVCPDCDVRFSQIRECNRRGFTWQTPERDCTALVNDNWWHHMEAHGYSVYVSCGIEDTKAAAAATLIRSLILSPEYYHLYDDTLSVLAVCKQRGYRNVLLSNNFPELEDIVRSLDLLPYFDGMIVSALEGYDKPRPELFQIAKTRFPDTTYYMIGDNPNADVIGGKNAEMTTILVHGAFSSIATHCVESLSDILSIL